MHVTFCARHCALRNFEDLGELRSIEISVCSTLNSPISGLRDQWRQPADFQVETYTDEQVGIPQFQQEARLGFHEVGILISLGYRLHIDSIASDFLRESCQIGRGGDDVELFGEGERRQQQCCQQSEEGKSFHHLNFGSFLVRTDAPRGRLARTESASATR